MLSAYDEEINGEDTRVVLRLPVKLAPVKLAVFPLMKNKPELVAKAREVYAKFKKSAHVNLMIMEMLVNVTAVKMKSAHHFASQLILIV